MKVSIIVPCYNEENRIKPFLTNLIQFSKDNLKDYEIIVVNDGSKDKTLDILKEFSKNIGIISYDTNKGKGGAVREGVLSSIGEKVLFIDADGSIQPDEMPKMLEKLDNYDVVVGDRASKDSDVNAIALRNMTGKLFNFYVNMLFRYKNWDNLCGFKGFKKEIAKDLFTDLIAYGWIFDVELFYKIHKKHYTLYKLPIKWVHKGDSKIKLLDPFKMFFQLIKLRMKL